MWSVLIGRTSFFGNLVQLGDTELPFNVKGRALPYYNTKTSGYAGAADMGRQGRQMPTQPYRKNVQLTSKVESEKPVALLGADDIFK